MSAGVAKKEESNEEQNFGSPLLLAGESLWQVNPDTSGTGRSIGWLSIWKMQCPAPLALLNKAPEPLIHINRALNQPNIGIPLTENCPPARLPACRLPGPAGPPIDSRSASEPRERRHRSFRKRPLAPAGAKDRR